MPVMPKEKWDSIEQYIEYLRHLSAYRIFAKSFVEIKQLLEIGCGTGYGADYLSSLAADITAVDFSPENIIYCKKHHKKDNITFVVADGTQLPFKSDSFDVVISFQVIEHIKPNVALTYLSEIKRVLSEEGIFLCSTPNKKLRLLPFQKPWNPEHKREYNRKELKNLLSKVFEEVNVFGLTTSKEVLSIERARVKQNPFKVYVIRPLYRFVKLILPDNLLSPLKEIYMQLYAIICNYMQFINSKRIKEQSLVSQGEFLAKFSLENFKVDSSCSEDCLDLLGICKKINPLGDALNIESYSDFRRLIKGHSSKSLKTLYDKHYFTNCVGSKELADRFFKTKGLGTTRYTKFPMKLANIQRGNRVLDVGCGRGEIVFQTANLGAISTGIDFSKDAIEIAKSIRDEHSKEIINKTNFICCRGCPPIHYQQ